MAWEWGKENTLSISVSVNTGGGHKSTDDGEEVPRHRIDFAEYTITAVE